MCLSGIFAKANLLQTHLLDLFLDWTSEPARSAILSANPARLYDFPGT